MSISRGEREVFLKNRLKTTGIYYYYTHTVAARIQLIRYNSQPPQGPALQALLLLFGTQIIRGGRRQLIDVVGT